MYKKISAAMIVLAVFVFPAIASAHVVVKPAEVGVGSFQTFTTGVPNEKDQPVTGLRLVMPAGLNYVAPNVKPGWDINIVKDGDTVKEIEWTGGSIPAGQRDDFQFSAQAPAKTSTIDWKAYQTYEDGTVVSWDQKPSDNEDEEGTTPFSSTKVVNDLATPAAAATTTPSNGGSNLAVFLAAAALVISAAGFMTRKKN